MQGRPLPFCAVLFPDELLANNNAAEGCHRKLDFRWRQTTWRLRFLASQRIECGDSLGARASSPRKWTRRGAPWERGLPARENIPAEEPKNVLDRVIDAFCTNRPLQSDEMAALAEASEVTGDEIYETGYRWHFAANAWAISPEAVGRKFVPFCRYRGLDGKWHDTRRDGGRRFQAEAQRKLDDWHEGVTKESVKEAIARYVDSGIINGNVRIEQESARSP